jgi:hypothetical protein
MFIFVYYNKHKLNPLDCESTFLFGASINSPMASPEKRGLG